MSALDDIVNLSQGKTSMLARAELAQLRADLDAAQRERDDARSQLAAMIVSIDGLLDYRDHNTLNFQLEKADDWLNQLRAMTRTTSQSAMLTPRRCETCAQEAAREMRDNAENICRDWNRAPYLVGSHFGGDSIPFAMRFHLADAIAALPLPSCDGCNPLKPEAKDEATR